ncbi:hypothetical protein PBAC_11020 [Pedobacter glucosidilyticus]|nr:DUF4174 domain-containing protein [Pedobacter glucosidilyticus]KHJ38763.1 hypothetical protein PBAC_11020 [Pedobacter glucosidilyticus]
MPILSLLILAFSFGCYPPQFRDYREVILLAPHKEDATYIRQLQVLKADEKGLAERDIKLSTYFFDEGLPKEQLKLITKPHTFTIILLGKDGGEKYRSHQISSLNTLYKIIDVMPMRRAEMGK